MKTRALSTLMLGGLACAALLLPRTAVSSPAAANTTTVNPATSQEAEADLRPPSAFAPIGDPQERSAALFAEAGKVLLHPRCVNCHPAGESPLQGEGGDVHQPVVERGKDGFGVVGMRCTTCHMQENYDPGRVPGAALWHLAPAKMAWEGMSLAQICEQIKDPLRNGGRELEAVVRHMAEDELVGWAWQPGANRQPAPGTQKALGELLEAWAAAGAVCP